MLTATVITLEPVDKMRYQGPTGRHVQAWFLSQVGRHSPSLVRCLHDGRGYRPYTASALMAEPWHSPKNGPPLIPDKPLYLRITTLTDELSQVWLDQALMDLPPFISLNRMDFRVQGWTNDPQQHPWADQQTCGDIYQQADLDSRRTVKLWFASPTSFTLSGVDNPVPIPGLMLSSWQRRWNAVATETLHLSERWLENLQFCVHVGTMNHVRTLRWAFERRGAIGFLGEVGLTLIRRGVCRQRVGNLAEIRQMFHFLCTFAFYCGTGQNTTVGMGQTRRIDTQRKC